MFAIESWPSSPAAPGLRIRTSADPAVLADVFRPEWDVVIWTRSVPPDWSREMAQLNPLPAPVCVEGRPEDVRHALAARQGKVGWPSFVLEDINQNAAMARAFGVATRQRLKIVPIASAKVQTGMQETEGDPFSAFVPAVGKCCVLCCYGAGGVEWMSGQPNVFAAVSGTEGFAIVLVRGEVMPSVEWAFRYRFRGDGTAPALGLLIEAF